MLYIDTVKSSRTNEGDWILPVKVQGPMVSFKLDTRSQVNSFPVIKIEKKSESNKYHWLFRNIYQQREYALFVSSIKLEYTDAPSFSYLGDTNFGLTACEKCNLVKLLPAVQKGTDVGYKTLMSKCKDLFEGLRATGGQWQVWGVVGN